MDSGFLYRFLMFLRGIRNYNSAWNSELHRTSWEDGSVDQFASVSNAFLCPSVFSLRFFFLGTSESPVFVILFFEAIYLVIVVLNANLIVRLNSQLSLLGVKSIIKTQTMSQPLRQITSYYY